MKKKEKKVKKKVIKIASQEPDFTKRCLACNEFGVWPLTGMCGPCTTGSAEDIG